MDMNEIRDGANERIKAANEASDKAKQLKTYLDAYKNIKEGDCISVYLGSGGTPLSFVTKISVGNNRGVAVNLSLYAKLQAIVEEELLTEIKTRLNELEQ